MQTQTKIANLKTAVLRGDWKKALSIAAKFPQLGEHRAAIVTAHECLAHPGFYQQLGKDEAALIEEGKQALRVRYSL